MRANKLFQTCMPRLIGSISRGLPLEGTCYVQQVTSSLMLAVASGFDCELASAQVI